MYYIVYIPEANAHGLDFDSEHAPSIIFMEKIDSIISARMESGTSNVDSEVQRTMLELLDQLDGFEASNKIKVLMETNRILDILGSSTPEAWSH